MIKYNWDKHKLHEICKRLEDALEQSLTEEESEKIIFDITTLYKYLDELEYPNYDDYSMLEYLNKRKKFFQNIPFLIDDFLESARITQGVLIEIPNWKRWSLSKDDLLELTHDFYKNMGRFFYKKFMVNFKDRYKNVNFSQSSDSNDYGVMIPFVTTKKALIDISREFTALDFTVLVHEYAHAITLQASPNYMRFNESLFSEMDGHFLELLAINYLQKKTNIPSSELLKANFYNLFSELSQSFYTTITLLKEQEKRNKLFTSNKELKQCAAHLNINPNNILKHLLNIDNSCPLYLTAYMFAIELYYLYQLDPEKALYIYKKIITSDYSEDLKIYEDLKKMGIYPNTHLEDFYKEAKETILTRKKV